MISPKKLTLTGINAHDKAESLHFSNKARRELKAYEVPVLYTVGL